MDEAFRGEEAVEGIGQEGFDRGEQGLARLRPQGRQRRTQDLRQDLLYIRLDAVLKTRRGQLAANGLLVEQFPGHHLGDAVRQLAALPRNDSRRQGEAHAQNPDFPEGSEQHPDGDCVGHVADHGPQHGREHPGQQRHDPPRPERRRGSRDARRRAQQHGHISGPGMLIRTCLSASPGRSRRLWSWNPLPGRTTRTPSPGGPRS